jgi:SAM-dependent methyltransferase
VPFPDDSFDLVVGRAILHHLNLDQAVGEIHRVLRREGKAVFIEPLGDNPGAKLLRFMTPRARTRDEKPLTGSDIRRLDADFSRSSHYFLGLVSVPLAMLTSLAPDSTPLCVADRVDQWLAHTPLRYWMRQVILIWHKA